MDAEMNGLKFTEEQDIYIIPKYLPSKYLLITQGKVEI